MRIFTIGHGARTFAEFGAVLAAAGVTQVIDVRRYPGSRRHPQFGRDALVPALAATGCAYEWLSDLGGRRGKGPQPSPNPAWRVEAFRNYADYMDAPAFSAGIAALLAHASGRPSAIMCAERHPSQCHRRLIADKFTSLGHEVLHLLSPTEREAHRMPSFLRIDGDRLRYDLTLDEQWQGRLL